MSADDLRRVKDAFGQSRSHRVEFTIQSIDVKGDQAEASGRRRDDFVSIQGVNTKGDAAFRYRFRRGTSGWVIDAVQ
jgi:hypothetical protein